jgi:type VI secretion system protein ImpG
MRRLGAEFAEAYPKVASRLMLEPAKCEDPHVERLLEGFAFLAARVHLKLDDDFPEISEALLNVVYPHYVRPIPSMSLVEIHLDPDQGKPTAGLRIPRDSALFSRPVGGVPCKFRSCYDLTIWPLTIAGAQWTTPDRLRPAVRATEAVAALRLDLHCLPDVTFSSLAMDSLRLHLSGEGNLTTSLYELLCNSCTRILIRDTTPGGTQKTVTLPASALKPVGFGSDEGMLPYPKRSFIGYRLLQEYFTFPEKFLFVDLTGLAALREAGFGNRAEVLFIIAPFERGERRSLLEAGVSEKTFRTGCTPVVNLFSQVSEPVLLTERQQEYRLVADARRRLSTEIFSIDEVTGITPGSSQTLHFEPFYAHRHGSLRTSDQMYWAASRRPSGWRSDRGTDLWLSFVDLSSRVVYPDVDAVTSRLTCFNGDLPSRLPFGNDDGDFELEGGGPIRKIVALVKPTPVVQPPLGRPQLWRLISQLSLNYLSLVDGGTEALQELLRLHNFAEATAGEKQIQGILDVRSAPAYARVRSDQDLSFARGRRVELDLDEEQFAGGGVFLFSSVLERFFGLYASVNSFSRLSVRTRQRKGALREWAPRAGSKALL